MVTAEDRRVPSSFLSPKIARELGYTEDEIYGRPSPRDKTSPELLKILDSILPSSPRPELSGFRLVFQPQEEAAKYFFINTPHNSDSIQPDGGCGGLVTLTLEVDSCRSRLLRGVMPSAIAAECVGCKQQVIVDTTVLMIDLFKPPKPLARDEKFGHHGFLGKFGITPSTPALVYPGKFAGNVQELVNGKVWQAIPA